MSKELKALNDMLEYLLTYDEFNEKRHKHNANIIETALKRLEVYETFGLLDEKYDDVDKLTDIKGKLTYVDRVMDTQERLLASVSSDEIRILNSVLNSQIRNLKKKLKGLEILKEEFKFYFNDEKQTIEINSVEKPYTHIRFSLTRIIKDKEKYDILKEVLL